VKENLEKNHWIYLELPTTHRPMNTMPETTAEILLKYATGSLLRG